MLKPCKRAAAVLFRRMQWEDQSIDAWFRQTVLEHLLDLGCEPHKAPVERSEILKWLHESVLDREALSPNRYAQIDRRSRVILFRPFHRRPRLSDLIFEQTSHRFADASFILPRHAMPRVRQK